MLDAGTQTNAQPIQCPHPECPGRAIPEEEEESAAADDDDDDDSDATIAAEIEDSRYAAINEVLEHFAEEQLKWNNESE